ncbi:DHA2 family efflux MFS transporter permease subunit [Legionella jordanis]|uniref:Multidrug efflux protein n=1 Tax=Legionella jordanis TaxID=456 RepID=A0A0W0VAG8_9GAMM|nr:DHA2 family efflux MFS transporter permease subunit [Legionella jordanis]KTD17118.1 multidrug efflux protein [Legionella jordanis]RMX03249.1 DHA2 family efflux MFS transporter permease subunit [Legionella jordanis]VEH12685.1 multidrug efflux protein [Legionella jordanis]HAT8713166.1 DHA2 family efflux MFS transporter permease subunit [Legionella jordanis]
MKKNIILVIVAFAMFMEAVDTTVINTAIPVMAKSLKANPIDLKLALISYLLSLAIFIPISGWIADKFGAKKTFISAVFLFTLSSIACGSTQSLEGLVLARIAQGLGGSLTLPVGRLIIIRTCERHELIAKMSIVVMVAAIGMMSGPVIGGFITTHISWRWIFWVNVPIGLLTIVLANLLLPAMPARPVHKLDKIGFVLFGSSLAALTFGLSLFSESSETHSYSLMIIAAAILLMLFYIKHSRSSKHPVVKMELLAIRTFRISVIGNLVARLGFGGLPFLLPLLIQIGLGFSAQLSGLLLAPIALGVLLVKPLSLSILRLFGYKNLLIINTVLVALSLCSFVLVSYSMSLYGLAVLTFIYGFLIALQYTAMNSLAYANVHEDNMSSATSIMSTVQQLAQSFGVAVAAILVRIFSGFHEAHLTVRVFHEAFLGMGLLTLCTIPIFLFLKQNDGHELIEIPERTLEGENVS